MNFQKPGMTGVHHWLETKNGWSLPLARNQEWLESTINQKLAVDLVLWSSVFPHFSLGHNLPAKMFYLGINLNNNGIPMSSQESETVIGKSLEMNFQKPGMAGVHHWPETRNGWSPPLARNLYWTSVENVRITKCQ
jgi:hypothetical protein